MKEKNQPRCDWAGTDPLYISYHDTEWGVPLFNDRALFELLILEGAQAGLSWITILRRRAAYRRAFDRFDPQKIARYDAKKFQQLLADPGIIRNRLKIQATISNAQAFLNLKESGMRFSDYLWQFVDGNPIQNQWKTQKQVPAHSLVSDKMAKDLKKRGFKFVGTTICYAYMQAIGMVNDHLQSCFRCREVEKLHKTR